MSKRSSEDYGGSSSKKIKDGCKFKKHRNTFDEVYFTDSDIIQVGSKEYDDFWLFLDKYQHFKQIKKFSASSTYNKINKVNLCFNKNSKIKKCLIKEEYRHDALKQKDLEEFEEILLLYYDFLQKQKLTKVRKLKQDQMNLPIFKYKQGIVDAVKDNQVVVVAGDTGCGKSTQVPQYLMDAAYERIACTQPRRIACISLAKRVSYETLNQYGSKIAYQVRFDRTRTKNTRVVFLTEGLLLRQINTDPSLDGYDVIVVDEVHERHLQTDFLLGVLKCILYARPSLKLVLMSATININLFSKYFNNAPVAMIPGRLFPIQMQYLPIEKLDTQAFQRPKRASTKIDPVPFIKVLQLIDSKYSSSERGDALIFVSGLQEITTLVEAIQEYNKVTNTWIALPLHSSLSLVDQDKVFDYPPEGVRKVVVSTNIAETSVTIDGIRFVIDSGKVKELVHDGEARMARLKEQWTSKASCEQRRGRAGRTGPGICFRLFSSDQYDQLEEYSLAEIHRVPLQSLVLQMVVMGIPDARVFPFIDAPPIEKINKSLALLTNIGALDPKEAPTQIGKTLAQLPVDLVIGKILIMGSMFVGLVDSVVMLCGGLSLQSLYNNKAHKDLDMCKRRKSAESDHGDPLTSLNLVCDWLEEKGVGNDTRAWCKRRGIEEQRLYELMKLRSQFRDLLMQNGLVHDEEEDEDEEAFTSDSHKRRQKHADRQRLRHLKRQGRNDAGKRKYLKLNMDEMFEDDEAMMGDDVGDLEFRLTHDVINIETSVNKNRKHVVDDVDILKLILVSGLYPQLALPDEHNSNKPDVEQFYHTTHRPFIALHPTSILATNPALLIIKRHKDTDTRTTSRHKGVYSHQHQLLCYVTLLETTKPYLINAFRVFALPTLLLLSNRIDVSRDTHRVVFDKWLDVEVHQSHKVSDILCDVIAIRSLWQRLLRFKLEWAEKVMEEEEDNNDDDAKNKREEIDDDENTNKQINKRSKKKRGKRERKIERGLEREIVRMVREMYERKMVCRLRRMMSAEINKMHRDPQELKKFLIDNQLEKLSEVCEKPGIEVTSYMFFDSLDDDGFFPKKLKEEKNTKDDDDGCGDDDKDDENENKDDVYQTEIKDEEEEDEDSSMKEYKIRTWDCKYCHITHHTNTVHKLLHCNDCVDKWIDGLMKRKGERGDGGVDDDDGTGGGSGERGGGCDGGKGFKCDECGGVFSFTISQMVDHWKECQSASGNT